MLTMSIISVAVRTTMAIADSNVRAGLLLSSILEKLTMNAGKNCKEKTSCYKDDGDGEVMRRRRKKVKLLMLMRRKRKTILRRGR